MQEQSNNNGKQKESVMKHWVLKIVGTFMLSVMALAAHAATDIDLSSMGGLDQSSQPQQFQTGIQMSTGGQLQGGNQFQSGISAQTGNQYLGGGQMQSATGALSDGSLLRILENKESSKERDDLKSLLGSKQDITELDDENSDIATRKDDQQGVTKKDRKKRTPKTQLLVTPEADDGLVRLSWRILNPPAQTDEKLLRFIVRVGVESQLPTKTLQVGTSDSCVLRGLKNNQPYFVQVLAVDRENLLMYKSEEIKVTPLSLEEQSSLLEKAFSKKTTSMHDTKIELETLKRDLHQFGYDFFKNSSQLLTATDSLPVGSDYTFGPGDTLNLNLWGALNARYELIVDRNGEIMIPKVGAVKVWGLNYEQGKASINKAIGRYFKNYEMGLTLGSLRTIKVYVVGEVKAPGNYPVSSLATVINALSAAGGPTRNGSLRIIKVTRAGQPPLEVDLYDFLLSGDRSKDVRLENGDTIFVPLIGPVVAVAGEVRRPAIYEIRGKTTIPDMLKMAGGILATGFTGRIQVERAENNSSRVALDFEPKDGSFESALGTVTVKDRDMLKVFPIQEAVRKVVLLKGNVIQPGEYQYRNGMRLSDLIPSFNSLLPESYLESVEIVRLSPPEYRREMLTANLRRALGGNEADNILLQEQDTVRVFARSEMTEKPRVFINGAVISPGAYDFYPGMTIRDLVTTGGSPKRNAFLETGELSRVMISGDKANPYRISVNLSKAIAGDPQHNLALQPDDVLMVRSVTNWFDATDRLVKLEGEVRFPGVYSVARGEKLSSLLERAGGFTEKAYLRGAKFTRRSVKDAQQKRLEEFIARSEKEITTKQAALASVAASSEELQATKAALEGLSRNLERMKGTKAEGRVVIRLAPLGQLGRSDSDVALEGGDELFVPPRPSVVNVMGEVYNPVSFVYNPESSEIGAYLKRAGGPTREAEREDMYVIRADGTVFSRTQASFGIHWSDDARKWTFGSFDAIRLEPGDSLVVPQKLEHLAWTREIKDITTILSQIALTAGVVLASGL